MGFEMALIYQVGIRNKQVRKNEYRTEIIDYDVIIIAKFKEL